LTQAAVRRLADLLARLHEAGFSHRDLKASNVLLDDQLRPWLIDLDGVRRFRRLSEARAVADLARLAREFATSPTLLRWSGRRFLLQYCVSRNIPAAFRRLDARLRSEL
jgi:tRNA A-37 threonylcarbamoyl transferase component Bud32